MSFKQAKWNLGKECQKAFGTMKKLDSRETLLSYSNFNKPFVIHTDTSKLELGEDKNGKVCLKILKILIFVWKF